MLEECKWLDGGQNGSVTIAWRESMFPLYWSTLYELEIVSVDLWARKFFGRELGCYALHIQYAQRQLAHEER